MESLISVRSFLNSFNDEVKKWSCDGKEDAELFPLPNRALHREEEFAILAAIHDVYLNDSEIKPWPSTWDNTSDAERDASIRYGILKACAGEFICNEDMPRLRSVLDRLEEELTGKPSAAKINKYAKHSPDFRSLNWFGTSYSFTANQAPVIQTLFESWKTGAPEVGSETLLSAVDDQAPPERLATLFRAHNAWGTLIVDGESKGTKRLAEPDQENL